VARFVQRHEDECRGQSFSEHLAAAKSLSSIQKIIRVGWLGTDRLRVCVKQRVPA
jgi:hypothetical protein